MSGHKRHADRDKGAAAIPTSPYDKGTLRALNALTTTFYAQEASSFSATRQAPWHGWDRALDAIAAIDPSFPDRSLTVLDLACGNLRFEAFLSEHGVSVSRIVALDTCPALAQAESIAGGSLRSNALGETLPLELHEVDLVETLIDSGSLAPLLPQASCDLAVAFGFMHHIAAPSHRVSVVRDLTGSLRPNGFAVLSFWQFMNDPRIAAKAVASTAEGRMRRNLPPLAPNDYLLGWQHAENVYRFCHHTSDDEIDALLASAGVEPASLPSNALPAGAAPSGEPPAPTVARAATPYRAAHSSEPPAAASRTFREVARFSADGKRGDLNRYVILKCEGAKDVPIC